MQVFKCAMRIIRGNIIFPIIYIVGLSFMASSWRHRSIST